MNIVSFDILFLGGYFWILFIYLLLFPSSILIFTSKQSICYQEQFRRLPAQFKHCPKNAFYFCIWIRLFTHLFCTHHDQAWYQVLCYVLERERWNMIGTASKVLTLYYFTHCKQTLKRGESCAMIRARCPEPKVSPFWAWGKGDDQRGSQGEVISKLKYKREGELTRREMMQREGGGSWGWRD